MNGLLTRFLLSLLFGLGAALSAFAQGNAQFQGRVTDPEEAVVAGAEVQIVNQATGVERHLTTNSDGLYTAPFLLPGTYRIQVAARGFSTASSEPLTLTTGQSLAFDVRLKIGSATETITVAAESQHLNTTDAFVSTVVDQQFVANIPMNGRSFQSLITLTPGVVDVPGGVQWSVNGQRTDENYFTVDGVSGSAGASVRAGRTYGGAAPNFTALGTSQSLLSADAIQEFRAITSTYEAEYGRVPGGQFAITSRSGNTVWHGSLYNYVRNDALDANNWFNNSLGLPRQAERQNDFGGTFGGPVRMPKATNGSDRTFFFFSYEGLRLVTPNAAQTYTVPSLSLRQQAPQALQWLMNSFPLPNGPDLGNGLAGLIAGYSTSSAIDSVSLRVDHTLSDRFRLFGRYYGSSSNSSGYCTECQTPLAVTTTPSSRTEGGTAALTSLISQAVSNDLRVNFVSINWKNAYTFTSYGGAIPPDLATYIPGYVGGNTSLQVAFRFGGRFAGIVNRPASNRQNQLNLVDNVAVAIGSHNLKFGADYRRSDTWTSYPTVNEVYQFNSQAGVIANNLDGFSEIFTSPYNSFEPVYNNAGLFIQDNWTVTPRLSLSPGLRWDINPAPHDAEGRDPYTLTQITDLATTSLAAKGTRLWQTQYGNVGPRFGVVYQLRTANSFGTVLRAGVGKYFDNANVLGGSGYAGVGDYSVQVVTGSAFPFTAQQIAAVPPASANPPYSANVYGFDPHLKSPYTIQWNAAVQQGVGAKQSVTLTYVGAAGRDLLNEGDFVPGQVGNPFFVGFTNAFIIQNLSSSAYKAMQIQFQRQLSHGFQILASYTWSHATDDLSTNVTRYNLLERADSDFDLRHNFQAAATYRIPGQHRAGVIGAVADDWNIDARIIARSGLPVDIWADSNYYPGGQYFNIHPNRVAGQPLYLYSDSYPGGRIINFNAFSVARDSNGNEIEGNAGRNIARGLGLTEADVAIHKNFVLTRKLGLQFRVEAFNVLNHPMFGAVYNGLYNGAALFGRFYTTANTQPSSSMNSLYQTGGPRTLQLALKLQF